MLSHERIKAIEQSLGPQAPPVIEALKDIVEDIDKRFDEQKLEVKRDLLVELATKADIQRLEGAINTLREATRADIASMETKFEKRMTQIETLLKLLIGLSIIGMAFFSPNAAELIRLLK